MIQYRFTYCDRERIVHDFHDDRQARRFAVSEPQVILVQQESSRRVVWRRVPPGDPWRNKEKQT